jgi:hypothetical protein
MRNFVRDMLHNSLAAQKIEALWKVAISPLFTLTLTTLIFATRYRHVHSYRSMKTARPMKLDLLKVGFLTRQLTFSISYLRS